MRILLGAIVVVWLSICSLALRAQAPQWTKIDTSGGLIKVSSSIAGIKGYSIIDTGASVSAINSLFIKRHELDLPRLGSKASIQGVVSEKSVDIYAPIQVEILDANLNVSSLVDVELDDSELQLIVGAGLLRQFVFQFDYPRQRMRLLSRDAVQIKKARNVKSKRAFTGGPPLLKVRLNDEINAWLMLDTGSTGGVILDRKIVKRTSWLSSLEISREVIRGIHEFGQTDTFLLPTIRFGPFELGSVKVSTQIRGAQFKMFEQVTLTGTHIPRSSSTADGLVGYEVLKHFVISLDYKGGHVHIGTKASP